ncbi:MAG: hypothetical protein ACT6FG_00395 [Methanosarcinaceae archaeon]
MNKQIGVILILVILISLTPIGSASLGDAVSNSFAKGGEQFFINCADRMFDMSFSGYDSSGGNNTVGYIYNIASYTPNPMKSDITYDFIDFSKSIFYRGYKLILLAAFIAVLVIHFKPNALRKLSELMGVNLGSTGNILVNKVKNGIIIIMLMYTFIYFVLEINDMLTKAVMIEILDVISPTPDNFILYFMMAIAYLFMGFFFMIRTLILFLFCGFAFLVALGLLMEFTKESAINACAYFVQTVIFQFFIVLYFSASVLIIKALPTSSDFDVQTTMYTVMIIGGIYIGIKMMFGTGVIRFAGRTAARLV